MKRCGLASLPWPIPKVLPSYPDTYGSTATEEATHDVTSYRMVNIVPSSRFLFPCRLDERRGGSGLGVAARALKTCPRTAELYHLAARAELSQVRVGYT